MIGSPLRACTHVAMESTGVYWKPLCNLLEGRFTLLLVNARHIKAVPGRKTDVKDSAWIADLLRHGLLHPSFVPPRPQREIRGAHALPQRPQRGTGSGDQSHSEDVGRSEQQAG